MINAVIKGLSLAIGPVTAWLEGKRQQVEAKTQASIENTRQHLSGISDEYLLFILSYPFWSAFVPVLAPYTHKGFEHIALMPDWYVNLFGGAVVAVLGVNGIGRIRR